MGPAGGQYYLRNQGQFLGGLAIRSGWNQAGVGEKGDKQWEQGVGKSVLTCEIV